MAIACTTEGGRSGTRARVVTAGMAYGAHAVARDGARVLFVRGAAPGEEVEIGLREDRGSFAFADLRSVVRPSSDRRPPPCPFLPRCGGCSWQHLTYSAQLTAKRQSVREQLKRIGGVNVPVARVIASPVEFGYRRRLKLRVDGQHVGFAAARSHALVPVDRCLLAEGHLSAAIPRVARLVRALRTRLRRIELIGSAGEHGVVLAIQAEGAWSTADAEVCANWVRRDGSVRGMVMHGRRWRRHWGDTRIRTRSTPQLTIETDARAFTQVNALLNPLLVQSVQRLAAPVRDQRVLDLYAGSGNFSLALAQQGARVLAVEEDAGAVSAGRENARRLGLRACRFVHDRVERAVRGMIAHRRRFDVVLLDPPRSGAASVIELLAQLQVKRIVYVSCDPATLARDIGRLRNHVRVGAVQPFDLFPQTYHVETVLRADFSCPRPGGGVSSVTKDKDGGSGKRRGKARKGHRADKTSQVQAKSQRAAGRSSGKRS